MLDKIKAGWSWVAEPIKKALDIVDQAVPDSDLREKLKHQIAEIQSRVRIAELQTQTVPWMDGLHKLARPILWTLQLVISSLLLWSDPTITVEQLAALNGGPALYTALKGRGN